MSIGEDLRNGLISAAVSGENALVYGEPGWGKTRAALTFLKQVFEEEVGFLVLSPATPPERVEGSIDIPRYLEEGVIAQTVAGTPHDPAYRAWVLDEVGRANEAVLDALLPVLESHDGHRPLAIATTNFMPRGKRFDALRTRFGLWIDWRPSATPDVLLGVADGVLLHGDTWGIELEDDEVEAIHHARSMERLGANPERLRPLVEAALEAGYPLTPRWMRVLANVYGRGAEYYRALLGVPMDDAEKRAFAWLCWAIPTAEEARRNQWALLVDELVAPEEAAIKRVMVGWQEAVEAYKADPANDQALRQALANSTASLVELEEKFGVETNSCRKRLTKEFLEVTGALGGGSR